MRFRYAAARIINFDSAPAAAPTAHTPITHFPPVYRNRANYSGRWKIEIERKRVTINWKGRKNRRSVVLACWRNNRKWHYTREQEYSSNCSVEIIPRDLHTFPRPLSARRAISDRWLSQTARGLPPRCRREGGDWYQRWEEWRAATQPRSSILIVC